MQVHRVAVASRRVAPIRPRGGGNARATVTLKQNGEKKEPAGGETTAAGNGGERERTVGVGLVRFANEYREGSRATRRICEVKLWG